MASAPARETEAEKAGWTPGPWKALVNMAHSPMVQRGIQGGFVVRGLSRDQEIADARLIAAAPEMYEALKAALPLLKRYSAEREQYAASVNCAYVGMPEIEAVSAALLKATGALS